jgi:hypothetical protein
VRRTTVRRLKYNVRDAFCGLANADIRCCCIGRALYLATAVDQNVSNALAYKLQAVDLVRKAVRLLYSCYWPMLLADACVHGPAQAGYSYSASSVSASAYAYAPGASAYFLLRVRL